MKQIIYGVPLTDSDPARLKLCTELVEQVLFSTFYDGVQSQQLCNKIHLLTSDQIKQVLNNFKTSTTDLNPDSKDSSFFLSKFSFWHEHFKLSEDDVQTILQKYRLNEAALYEALHYPRSSKGIFNYLKKFVIGQDSLLKTVAVAAYIFLLKINSIKREIDTNVLLLCNLLLIGNTGSGKTYTIKTLAKFLKKNYFSIDSSSLVISGIVGDTIQDKFTEFYKSTNCSISDLENSIIFFDEIDKKCSYNRKGDTGSYGVTVQMQMLKLLEKDSFTFPSDFRNDSPQITINTSNILFVFSGAFAGIEEIVQQRIQNEKSRSIGFKTNRTPETTSEISNFPINEDLIKYGLLPEFLGRIGKIVTLNTLSQTHFKEILDSESSPIKSFASFFQMHGKSLTITDAAKDHLADFASQSGLGARALSTKLNEVLYPKMFDIESNPNNQIVISIEDFINH